MDKRNENVIDKNDKSYIDKYINGNKYSNENNNVNDIHMTRTMTNPMSVDLRLWKVDMFSYLPLFDFC